MKNRRRLCDDGIQEAPAGQGKVNAIAVWRKSQSKQRMKDAGCVDEASSGRTTSTSIRGTENLNFFFDS